jgi:PPM family protein phosphatase
MIKIQRPASHTLKWEVGKATDTGVVRRHNEDSILALELAITGNAETLAVGLFAVADGVGGNQGGEIASNTALRALAAGVVKTLGATAAKTKNNGPVHKDVMKILTKSAQTANREVLKKAAALKNDMGTTLAGVLVTGNTAEVINAGDSRVYLHNRQGLEQITKDHSLVASLVEAGEITPEEIYTHPRRNIITRCLGTQPEIETDQFTREIHEGEALVICSDGLWEMVRDQEIAEIIGVAENVQSACDKLVGAANRNGGTDNISVIIVKMTN